MWRIALMSLAVLAVALSACEQETLIAKPAAGDYEIVGRRKGYQDVLLLVQVRYGSPPPAVSVTCRLTKDS